MGRRRWREDGEKSLERKDGKNNNDAVRRNKFRGWEHVMHLGSVPGYPID